MLNTLGPQDFVFDLPDELIAQRAGDRRDACRLLHLRREGALLSDRIFSELPKLLRRGDLLVLNDTRVIPAKFVARRATGGRIEGLFLHEHPDGAWEVLLKGAKRCTPGESLALSDSHALVLDVRGEQGHWTVHPSPAGEAEAILAEVGVTPLPPYIRREGSEAESEDRRDYQTVFARRAGAVAAPTAGLHFTDELLDRLDEAGVDRAFVTLHVGIGTFAPVKAATVEGHRMHSEWYELPAATVEAVDRARRRGGRVIAVGTTVVRVLESAFARDGALRPHSAWTDIFIYPPRRFGVVDALITNFHLPASTLIMLVAAFCAPGRMDGREMILAAYRHAVNERYRFFSYGDAMLID